MSVTFSVEMGPVTGFRVACMCGAVGIETETYADAQLFQVEWKGNPFRFAGCKDEKLALDAYDEQCYFDVPFARAVTADDDLPSVNVSSVNAREILETLGLNVGEDGLYGSAEPADLEGRILMAEAIAPESEYRPILEERNEGGATMIHCAREAGYVQNRLGNIRTVVEAAKTAGRLVVWS